MRCRVVVRGIDVVICMDLVRCRGAVGCSEV